jgi:hypothetical protein
MEAEASFKTEMDSISSSSSDQGAATPSINISGELPPFDKEAPPTLYCESAFNWAELPRL